MAKYSPKTAQGVDTTAAHPVLWCVFSAVLLFLVLCLNLPDSNKELGMALMILTFLIGIRHFSTLQKRINPPLLFQLLIVAMGGISTFYASSGKFALQGFLALMTALCTSLLLTDLPDSPHLAGRHVAYILAGAVSLISLFSLDMISTRLCCLCSTDAVVLTLPSTA